MQNRMKVNVAQQDESQRGKYRRPTMPRLVDLADTAAARPGGCLGWPPSWSLTVNAWGAVGSSGVEMHEQVLLLLSGHTEDERPVEFVKHEHCDPGRAPMASLSPKCGSLKSLFTQHKKDNGPDDWCASRLILDFFRALFGSVMIG